jgi:PAS domain S-box-containing protein
VPPNSPHRAHKLLPTSGPSPVLIGHWLMLAPLVAALLAVSQLAGVDLVQDAHVRSGAESSLFMPLLAAAAACAAAIFWHRQEWLIWGVLALALTLGAAAEAASPFSRQVGQEVSVAAALAYGVFCVASGATVVAASGKFRIRRAIDQGLGVCALGLATAWSWVFLVPAVSGGEVLHGAFDLLLALSVLAALCNHGWPLSARFATLSAGFGMIAVADSLHARGVLTSVFGLDLADAFPFAGAALIAAAACLGIQRGEGRPRSGRLVVILTLISMLVAIVALVYDHYHRLSSVTVLLASMTLLAAAVRLTLVQRGWRDARAHAREAEAAGSAPLDAAITIDRDGRVLSCNERAERLFLREEREIVGKPVEGLLSGGGDGSIEWLLSEGGGEPVELSALDGRGVAIPVEAAVRPSKNGSAIRTLVIRDISERRRREEENRRLTAIVRSSEDAVLTKDLAGVVTGWNQGAEHLYGYRAEEAIGQHVSELIVPRDRQGEVEWILNEVGGGKTISFETERITKAGAWIDVSMRAFPIRGLADEVTAVCTVAHDVSERRRRERAEERETEANLWRRRLRHALEDDDLLFHGQPILELKSGKIHHHELLVRMRLGGELVLPGSFLPFAEETELIRDLDLWAVERGMDLAARFPVAINLSARSLGSRGLLKVIERRLGNDGSLAESLTFEITETAAAENMQGARELAWELSKMGCDVALDDFGTGYGSFTYLRHLPVTQLKIDMEFITGIAADPADRRVVESMVAVARNFEMKTVAEGVEDRATFERVEELGVDLVQGYYVGRPQPLELEREAVHG